MCPPLIDFYALTTRSYSFNLTFFNQLEECRNYNSPSRVCRAFIQIKQGVGNYPQSSSINNFITNSLSCATLLSFLLSIHYLICVYLFSLLFSLYSLWEESPSTMLLSSLFFFPKKEDRKRNGQYKRCHIYLVNYRDF